MSFSLIPSIDYKNACNAVREKTGETAVIKSGDLDTEIGSIIAASEWYGTQAEYDALGSHDSGTLYYILA